MRQPWCALVLVVTAVCSIITSARADVTIASFDDFTSDALYDSWISATIDAGPTNYTIIATGYGSNYKFIGSPLIEGAGATTLRLDVTLSGPASAQGKLGPIVDLVDEDGTQYSYRWYGQSLGHRVLTMPIKAPTAVVTAGTTPGLSLTNLQHMHLQLDPGSFGTSGAYTVAWNDLSLTGMPVFKVTTQNFNPETGEFTLVWNSLPSKTYSVLHAPDLATPFSPLTTGVESGGLTTTNIVMLPAGSAGFVTIQQEE